MKSGVRLACGLLLVGLLSVAALAQQAATDGIVIDKDYPKLLADPAGSGASFIYVEGRTDTTKYPQIKINDVKCKMVVTPYGADGKLDPTKETTHEGTTSISAGTFSVNSTKEVTGGVSRNCKPKVPGKYRLKIIVPVQETPTSAGRDAVIETDVTITASPPPECGGEVEALVAYWRLKLNPADG